MNVKKNRRNANVREKRRNFELILRKLAMLFILGVSGWNECKNVNFAGNTSAGESVRFSNNRIDSFARKITVALGSHFQTKTISAAYKMSRVTLKIWEQVSINENAPRSNITALHVSSQYVVNIRLSNEINIDPSEFFW